MDFRSIIATIAALFALSPAGPVANTGESFKADTSAMVVYASLAETKVDATEGQKVRCLVFSFKGCPPCAALYKSIDKDLVPAGWKVGSKPTDDIESIDVYGKDERVKTYRRGRGWMCPTLILVDDKGKELDRRVGETSGKAVGEWIKSFRK